MIRRFNILRNEAGDNGDGGGGGLVTGQPAGGQGDVPGGNPATLLAPSGSPVATPNGGNGPTPTTPQNQAGNPATPGAFDFRSLVGDDGRFSANWVDKLPEGLKEHAAHFSKYGDPLQALQHTLSLSQLLGKKSDAVVIPGPDAGKDEWAPVLKRLGVPDSPDGYGLKVPEKLPEGVTVNPEELKEFAAFAHGLGLTPQQVAKLQEFDLGRAEKSVTGSAAQAAAQEEAVFNEQKAILTKAWGNGKDSVQNNALAQRAALTIGFTPADIGDAGRGIPAGNPLFKNASFVMAMAKVGSMLSEDTLVKGSDVNSSGSRAAQAADIVENKNNPLHAKYWAGDEAANAEYRRLIQAG